jgi:hypothetical protein
VPKIVNYRRSRHIDIDDVEEIMRLQMRRNRVLFSLKYDRDAFSYDEDEERNKVDGAVAKHTEGFYTLDCTWESEYDEDEDQYKGRLDVDIMFETKDDLESFEKNHVLLHKLSN